MAYANNQRARIPALRPCSAALLLALSLPTAAQEARQLGAVVVSASGFEQEVRTAPASISVVTREALESKQFRDLAEALSDIEGVDVRGATGKTGGLNISIRGLPSEYTLILIDGRRQSVAADVAPNGFGDALTSFMPPLSAIERIEVIRGPMATLYGADAMGGVVNIITRKVAQTWNGTVGVEMGLPQDGGDSDAQRLNIYANGPIQHDVLGVAVRGSIYRRGEAERLRPAAALGAAGGRDPATPQSRQYNLGARFMLTPDKDNDIWLDLEQNRTWYNNDDCRLGRIDRLNCATGATVAQSFGYRDYLRFNQDQIAIGHTTRLDFGVLESSLTRTVVETQGRTIPTDARSAGSPDIGKDRKLETTNTLFDTKLVTALGEANVLTVGGQWWKAELEDGLLRKRHDQTMWSLFAEDEWSITQSLVATFGLRHDDHERFGNQWRPRAYLVWTASDSWTVKGGVSTGFKAPNVNQLIDGVNGISGQGLTINIGNPNLQPEKSVSTEVGFLYDNRQGSRAGMTVFRNDIRDKIVSGAGDCAIDPISSCAANPTATYALNQDKAKTWGIELNGRVALAARWALSMNYTWTDSELIQDGEKVGKLSDTAEHMANAQLQWSATDKLNLWLRGEYRGKSRRFDKDPRFLTGNSLREYAVTGEYIKDYTLFHLGGSYKYSKGVTLNANIFNLFDKDFRNTQVYTNTAGNPVVTGDYFSSMQATKGSVPSGRMLWVSATVDF
ncbi:TonB-dependent receptor domain-containing protein [Thauera sp.]